MASRKFSVKPKITAAETTGTDDRFNDALDKLNNDFTFFSDGMELIASRGANATNDALALMENMQASLDAGLARLGDLMSSSGE